MSKYTYENTANASASSLNSALTGYASALGARRTTDSKALESATSWISDRENYIKKDVKDRLTKDLERDELLRIYSAEKALRPTDKDTWVQQFRDRNGYGYFLDQSDVDAQATDLEKRERADYKYRFEKDMKGISDADILRNSNDAIFGKLGRNGIYNRSKEEVDAFGNSIDKRATDALSPMLNEAVDKISKEQNIDPMDVKNNPVLLDELSAEMQKYMPNRTIDKASMGNTIQDYYSDAATKLRADKEATNIANINTELDNLIRANKYNPNVDYKTVKDKISSSSLSNQEKDAKISELDKYYTKSQYSVVSKYLDKALQNSDLSPAVVANLVPILTSKNTVLNNKLRELDIPQTVIDSVGTSVLSDFLSKKRDITVSKLDKDIGADNAKLSSNILNSSNFINVKENTQLAEVLTSDLKPMEQKTTAEAKLLNKIDGSDLQGIRNEVENWASRISKTSGINSDILSTLAYNYISNLDNKTLEKVKTGGYTKFLENINKTVTYNNNNTYIKNIINNNKSKKDVNSYQLTKDIKQ